MVASSRIRNRGFDLSSRPGLQATATGLDKNPAAR
jgi:hypothetical protein